MPKALECGGLPPLSYAKQSGGKPPHSKASRTNGLTAA